MTDTTTTDKLPTPLPTSSASTSLTSTTPIEGQLLETSAKSVKPGWKTSEFYFALAAKILSGLFAFGVVGDGSELSRLAGVAGFVLSMYGYTVSRTLIKNAAMVAVVLFAFHSAGCGASARQKTLTSTLAGLDSAEIGLVTFDKDYQDKIVTDCRDDSACNEAIGHQRLVEYRAKRDQIVMAIKVAYNMLGQAYKLDDDASMANVVAAAAVIATQLSALGVK